MSDKVTRMPRRTSPASEVTSSSTNAPGGGEESNRRVLKALVIGPTVKENMTTGRSKEMPSDTELDTLAASGKIIEPPFDPLVLSMLLEHSTELQPSIEAMEINIDGTGHRLESRVRVDAPETPQALKDQVEEERIKLTNLFSNCSIDDSFIGLRRKRRRDMETTGNSYWEVIRSPLTGEIDGFNHIPAHQMRLGLVDAEYTEFKRKKLVLVKGGEVQLMEEVAAKRFRTYAQVKLGSRPRAAAVGGVGGRIRRFKEFQDPRSIDCNTGEVSATKLPPEREANEILHFKLYSPRSPYGLPRFIGNLITIFGDRAADEINFTTLKNNNIPSMIVSVANGQLTEPSIQRMQEFVETQVQGSGNLSRFLIIEAEGSFEGQESTAKVDVKPLVSEQMRDQMFQKYGENNADKIRRSFRLPPLFVGRASDYNRASADAARELADDQIFKPERDEFDELMNKRVLPEMGIRFHKFISNGTNTTDPTTLIAMLMAAERTGGLTPRISRQVMSEVMNRDLPEIDPAKLDPDVPFSITIAEAVKNQAAMTTGSPEVGSQATALKGVTKGLSPNDILTALLLQRDAVEEQVMKSLNGDES